MRAYAIVRPQFWTRGSGKKLRSNFKAQVLAMYLMTCGQGTRCGIFPIALPTIAHETGIPLNEVPGLLGVVSEIAQYDDEDELCWIPNSAREQLGDSLKSTDNRWKGLVAELAPFLKHRFGRAFLEMYGKAYALPSGTPSADLPRPFEGSNDDAADASKGLVKNSNSLVLVKTSPEGVQGEDPAEPSERLSPPSAPRRREPQNLADAMAMPIAERAALVLRDEFRASFLEPEKWPEVLELAAKFGAVMGCPVKIGRLDRDKGTRRLLEALESFTVAQLDRAAKGAQKSSWFNGKSFSALSLEVLRRSMADGGTAPAEQPKPESVEDIMERRRLEKTARELGFS